MNEILIAFNEYIAWLVAAIPEAIQAFLSVLGLV